MAYCPLCEKKFKDRRGLHGHFRFVHGIEYGSGRPAKSSILVEATRKQLEEHKMWRSERARVMNEMGRMKGRKYLERIEIR